MVRLDLEDTYAIDYVSSDLSTFSFKTTLKKGIQIELFIRIRKHADPLLPSVYNLAFGPLDKWGEINDEIVLKHQNLSKVLSTVMFCAITFLNAQSTDISIGIDGSNDVRAYLYHRMFIFNYTGLSGLIKSVGVDWYVRLLRDGKDIQRDGVGQPLFKPRPESFDFNRKPSDLYRYYLFSLTE